MKHWGKFLQPLSPGSQHLPTSQRSEGEQSVQPQNMPLCDADFFSGGYIFVLFFS